MNSTKQWFAILGTALMLVPPAPAQQPVPGDRPELEQGSGIWYRSTKIYRGLKQPPIRLQNSSRLDALVRAGNLYLSLQDAIALALENNIDIEVQRYGPLLAEQDLRRAKAGSFIRGVNSQVAGTGGGNSFANLGGPGVQAGQTGGGTQVASLDPVLTGIIQANHNTSIVTNTVNTGVSTFIQKSRQANFGVQQAFLTGTSYNLGFNNQFRNQNVPFNNLNPTTSGSLSLQIQQRLLQGFGVSINNRNIRIASNNVNVANVVFQQQVITTVADVIRQYWDLVTFREAVKVREQALELSRRLYEDNKKQVEIGTLAPIEIVRAEAEVAAREQDLLTAQTNVLQQETLLKNALSRTGNFSATVSDARIVPLDSINIPENEAVTPIQDMVASAVAKRPELNQSRINIENSKISLTGVKNAMLPSLDGFVNLANNALVGSVNTLLPNYQPGFIPRGTPTNILGGYADALGQIFRRNYPDYGIGVQLNIPLRNRAAQADYATAQLQLRQNELQLQRQQNQIRVEVQNALIALQQARAAFRAAVKSRQLAEQTLDAEQKKFALGASSIFFVIQYQRDLANAKFVEVQALTTYARARVQLDVATGDVLDRNNVTVDEALRGQVSRPPSALPRN